MNTTKLFIPLLLVLALGSCQRDRDILDRETPQPVTASGADMAMTSSSDEAPGIPMQFEMKATVEEMKNIDGSRLLYIAKDRTKRRTSDGNTTPEGADYSREYSPSLTLEAGQTIGVYLCFVNENKRADGSVVAFRRWVDFTVIGEDDKVNNPQGIKNLIQYRGSIEFPSSSMYADYTLSAEYAREKANEVVVEGGWKRQVTSKWKVMGLIGPTTLRDGADTGVNDDFYALCGRNGGYDDDGAVIRGSIERYGSLASMMYTPRGEPQSNIYGVPFLSEWKPMIITSNGGTKDFVGIVKPLTFKPDGMMIQYDLGVDAEELLESRVMGIVSNVFDFAGSYLFNSDEIYDKMMNNQAPIWSPDVNAPTDHTNIGYADWQSLGLAEGNVSYPYDMPFFTDPAAGVFDAAHSAWSTTGNQSLSDATDNYIYFRGNVSRYPNVNYYFPDRITGEYNTADWNFKLLSGRMQRYTDDQYQLSWNRHLICLWGKRRESARKPANPYTYLWISTNSLATREDVYTNGWAPQAYLDPAEEAARKAREILALNEHRNLSESQLAKLRADVRAADKNYNEQLRKYIGYVNVAQAQSWKSIRTQPRIMLHQTNANFDAQDGKIVHIQTLLITDLIFTEVYYRSENGQNYSMLEITNPAGQPRDLSQYAVARMIPNGDKLSYRKADGTTTDRLSEAQILPLAYSPGQTTVKNPFTGYSWFADWAVQPNTDNLSERAKEIPSSRKDRGSRYGLSFKSFNLTGDYASTTVSSVEYNTPEIFYHHLMSGQSVLFAASGYINQDPAGQDWYRTVSGVINTGQSSYARNRYVVTYADGERRESGKFGEGTLDYHPGDVFVLIKKMEKAGSGVRSWQIIDATGPIGGKDNVGFAGTYVAYKNKLQEEANAHPSFSMQRDVFMTFPFMPPYRTKRIKPEAWSDDWSFDYTPYSLGVYREGKVYANDSYTGDNTLQSFEADWLKKRTPMDQTYQRYRSNRPWKYPVLTN